MPEIVAEPRSAFIRCFADPESSNLNDWVRIPFASRATRAGGGSEQARRADPVVESHN